MSDETADEIYQPYGDKCTVHTCDEDSTRYVSWDNTSLIAAFCDTHADSKLRSLSASEWYVEADTDHETDQ